MNLNKWNEIDLDMFFDVFNMYWEKESGTTDKVLELQNLIAIREGCPEVRVYFGANIRIEDFEKYNSSSINFMELLKEKFGPDFMKPNISMCLITDGPKINPLGDTKEHKDLIWSTCFGKESESEILNMILKPIILWFLKTPDGRYITGDYANKDVPDSKKYVRLRGWDYKDWKMMIDSYCLNDNFDINRLHPEDDVERSKIIYRRENYVTSEKP